MPCHRSCCCCWYHGCQGTCVQVPSGWLRPRALPIPSPVRGPGGCSPPPWVLPPPLGAPGLALGLGIVAPGSPAAGWWSFQQHCAGRTCSLPCQRARSLSIHGAIRYGLAGERPGDQGITPWYTQTNAEGNHSSWFPFGVST